MTEAPEIKLLQNHQVVVDRFINACEFDDRIVAAFLGGSYARGTADEHSDLDLYLVIADNAFDNFIANRDAFLHLFGEPVFIEDFDIPNFVFYIYADGTEGELWFGPASNFTHMHSGPYIVLVDKKNILTGVEFSGDKQGSAEQTEKLRQLIIGSGMTFPTLLLPCAAANSGGHTGNWRCCASIVLIRFYKELAYSLAQAHGLAYPDVLERVMVYRLENLGVTLRA